MNFEQYYRKYAMFMNFTILQEKSCVCTYFNSDSTNFPKVGKFILDRLLIIWEIS